jgi:hypothetical protein
VHRDFLITLYKRKSNRQFERKRCIKPPDQYKEKCEEKSRAKASEGKEEKGLI